MYFLLRNISLGSLELTHFLTKVPFQFSIALGSHLLLALGSWLLALGSWFPLVLDSSMIFKIPFNSWFQLLSFFGPYLSYLLMLFRVYLFKIVLNVIRILYFVNWTNFRSDFTVWKRIMLFYSRAKPIWKLITHLWRLLCTLFSKAFFRSKRVFSTDFNTQSHHHPAQHIK